MMKVKLGFRPRFNIKVSQLIVHLLRDAWMQIHTANEINNALILAVGNLRMRIFEGVAIYSEIRAGQ
jgi:hypothetical protein